MKRISHIVAGAVLCATISLDANAAKGGNSAGNSELEARLSELEALVIGLQSQVDANDADLADHQAKLQYVNVVEGELNAMNGPHFIIEGANVHVRSGEGSTPEGCNGSDLDCATRSGRGNLIIGYNEMREDYPALPWDCEIDPDGLDPEGVAFCSKRSGSHHLVVGMGHNYIGHGGMVAGIFGEARGSHATVTGGFGNNAQRSYASVSGGSNNFAEGVASAVGGGFLNHALGLRSAVSGGRENFTWGEDSAVAGGKYNNAEGLYSSVSGGEANIAFGQSSATSGGFGNNSAQTHSSITGGLFNRAEAYVSTISGGVANTVGFTAFAGSISGGEGNRAIGGTSSIAGGLGKTATPNYCVVGESGVDCTP